MDAVWVFSDKGFFSAVEDKQDPNVLVVRTRARKDARQLAHLVVKTRPGKGKAPSVVAGGGTDYPFRVRVTRREWADVLVHLSESIDYSNYKDAVKARQGSHRASVYSRVWGALLALESESRRGVAGAMHRGSRRSSHELRLDTLERVEEPDGFWYGDGSA